MPTKAKPAGARIDRVLASVLSDERSDAKRRILAEALKAFNANGIEATTIDDLRAASGQSVGTIYHHFRNKEGVVAALLFVAVDDQSRAIAERVAGQPDSQRMVEALVTAYLDWISTQPELARYVFMTRETVGQGPHGDALRGRLAARYRPVDECFARDVRLGRVRVLPEELVPALVLGPAEWYSRAWLAGRRTATPKSHAPVLAEAAWRSIERRA